jgi:hypothetical protein
VEDAAVGASGTSGAIAAGKNMRKHIIQVSTYHMVILMLFNQKESWTYDVSTDAVRNERNLYSIAVPTAYHARVSENIGPFAPIST